MEAIAKSVGPRIKKWKAEFEAEQKSLQKLSPNSADFDKAVSRLYDLFGRLRGQVNFEAMNRGIADAMSPGLSKKAQELEQLANSKNRNLSIDVSPQPTKTGWGFLVLVPQARIAEPARDTLRSL